MSNPQTTNIGRGKNIRKNSCGIATRLDISALMYEITRITNAANTTGMFLFKYAIIAPMHRELYHSLHRATHV